MKIILAGGTGFIGKALALHLVQEGNSVVLLTRNPDAILPELKEKVSVVKWDGETLSDWVKELDGADAVINLSGESVAGGRWSATRKEILLTSRINPTRAIVTAFGKITKKPEVLINASAVGFYGDMQEQEVHEYFPPGEGFLSELCEKWEKEASGASVYGVRHVVCRIGVVLERGGGALAKMITPFKLFIGGPLGSGRQWFAWIHRDDVIGAMTFALKNKNLSGAINLTSQDFKRLNEFCKILGKIMFRPWWWPVPSLIVKLMFGEMSVMLLTGQKVMPKRLLGCGYEFKYTTLESALEAILRKT